MFIMLEVYVDVEYYCDGYIILMVIDLNVFDEFVVVYCSMFLCIDIVVYVDLCMGVG